MRILRLNRLAVLFAFFVALPVMVLAAEIQPFAGTYVGQADVVLPDEAKPRDIHTTIKATKRGFEVSWTSFIYKTDGRDKENVYTVEFVPSQRPHIFGSAMTTNVFGKQTPLDPLKGEQPFVWSRFEGDTFSVFALFINESGEYELQEHHRTLVEGGLNLLFRRVRNGEAQREINAFLKRQ